MPQAHSRCVQRNVSGVRDAQRHFNDKSSNELTMVCIPKSASMFHMYLEVPSGFWILHQKFLKHQGTLDAGAKCCWPGWNKISHIVTRQTMTYSAPSQGVPTADNIMVDIDISLNFNIRSADDAAMFVYSLGAHRFDEYLRNEVEEGVRGLVYGVTHDKVNDLRDDFAGSMKENLKKKMTPFGITLISVAITNVALPSELQRRLQEATAYRAKIDEAEKRHENACKRINDEKESEMTNLNNLNDREKNVLDAQISRYETEDREKTDAANSSAAVQKADTESRKNIAISQAAGALEVGQTTATRKATEMKKSMEIRCNKMKAEVEQQANTEVKGAEAKLAASQNEAQAIRASAQAEAEAKKSMVFFRAYEVEFKRLEVMKALAGNGRRVISGDPGAAIMSELTPGGSDVPAKKGGLLG